MTDNFVTFERVCKAIGYKENRLQGCEQYPRNRATLCAGNTCQIKKEKVLMVIKTHIIVHIFRLGRSAERK